LTEFETVPASVEVLRENCFVDLIHLSSLRFEPGSNLREIEDSVFSNCQSLKSISLPASLAAISGLSLAGSCIETVVVDELNPHYFVSGDFLVAFDGMTLIRYFGHSDNLMIGREIEALGEFCFSEFGSLVTVAFESDSRLTRFDRSAFSRCSALASICIPVQVQHICRFCFSYCRSLTEVAFEQGSKLTRIDREAFSSCSSLHSFVIPTQLEMIESDVLTSHSLSTLIFEIPSRLRQLYVPMQDCFSLAIPDSVEVFTVLPWKCKGHDRFLQFGRESRLMTIHFRYSDRDPLRIRVQPEGNATFVRLSEGSLRRFRCNFETI
jgi:hypothetical protein